MSEKAECPRCGSYISEIFYDHRHRWCGWNCHVGWAVSAWNDGDSADLRLSERPTAEQRQALAALVGAESTTVEVTVGGFALDDFDSKSPWFNLDGEPPKPLSPRKAKAAMKALRDRLVEREVEDIDAIFKT